MSVAPDPPPVATVTPEALALLDRVGASQLLAAIAALEGVGEVTSAVLRGLGMGSTSGLRLVDCTSAAEASGERLLVARELVALDGRLVEHAHGDSDALRAKNAVLAVARLVADLVDALHAREREVEASSSATTSYVVSQSEEERGYSLTTYELNEVKRQKGVLIQMYNLHSASREGWLPTHAGMKRIAYWVKNEGCWPDPSRVSLDSMRREPNDSALLKFRRIAYGVLIVAAGEKVGPTTRHDGAGGVRKHASHATRCSHNDRSAS